jgi:hypothetical protein
LKVAAGQLLALMESVNRGMWLPTLLDGRLLLLLEN